MRVLLVSGTFPDQMCGVGDYTANLAAALARIEDVERVDVLTSRGPGPAAAIPGVEVHRVMDGWRIDEADRLTAAVDRIDPEIVHVMYPSRFGAQDRGALANAVPLLVRGAGLRRKSRSVVTTLHEFSDRSRAFRARAWLNLITSQALIFTSEFDERAALRWPQVESRVRRVVPIAPNIVPREPPSDGRAVRRRRGLGADSFLVVHFGLLAEDRGLASLAQASRWLAKDGIEVVVIGEPPPRASRGKRSTGLVELGAAEQEGAIRRLPHLPAAELSALLSAADAAVFPFAGGATARRGSLLAALAHGLPVVTTHGPRLPVDWSSDAAPALLVAPGDAAALAAAVLKLRDDGRLREQLATAGRKVSRGRSWDEIASRTAELYLEVAPG